MMKMKKKRINPFRMKISKENAEKTTYDKRTHKWRINVPQYGRVTVWVTEYVKKTSCRGEYRIDDGKPKKIKNSNYISGGGYFYPFIYTQGTVEYRPFIALCGTTKSGTREIYLKENNQDRNHFLNYILPTLE